MLRMLMTGKMKSNPLVSIITVTLNRSETLEHAIKSVIEQDYPNIQYIVVDGGSTDGSLDIIENYQHGISRWVSEPDRSGLDAMNKGFGMSSGEIVGYVHSDDYLEPGTVSAVVEAFSEQPEASVVHGDVRVWNFEEDVSTVFKPDPERPWKPMPVIHLACFVKRAVYEKCGLLDPAYKLAGDYELVLRLLDNGVKFLYLERILINMRLGGRSYQKSIDASWEARNIAIKYGYGRLKTTLSFLHMSVIPKIEKTIGNVFMRVGLASVVKFYRRVFYPHVPGDC